MRPLSPGSTIGILGGGQLGRMLAMAAARLGFKCAIYSDHRGPACDVAHPTTIGAFEDLEAIAAFAASVDVVTYEFENVPLPTAAAAAGVRPVRPGPKALEVAQDRLTEKSFISGLGIPVAPFAAIEREADLAAAIAKTGAPAILKTRRLGYDGKGQARIAIPAEAPAAYAAIGAGPAIAEGFVPFTEEISVLIVRSLAGDHVVYDIPRNEHAGGILRRSTVPGRLAPAAARRAHEIAAAIAGALDYVGVLAVEMFHVPDAVEPVIVNEIAPRVHNSGHWTIDACAVSQFENHIRAIAGWPLGDTGRHSDAVMDNLIGHDVDAWPQLATEPGTCVHLYGKHEARPGRKMGHVTRIRSRTG
jgi:5-(carboxyamino)imidazole ribonucleotide synthase